MICRRREQDASDRDRERYKNQLNVTGSEKGQLERLRLQLTEQVIPRTFSKTLYYIIVCYVITYIILCSVI